MTQNTSLYIIEFSRETRLSERRRFESMIIIYYVFIGIRYIVLPVHLRVSILKYCVVNAALFLDNPVRTVRPVLVTRPNQVPTIVLLLYYTVCLFYTPCPTSIVVRLCRGHGGVSRKFTRL